MANNFYCRTALTGGVGGALDAIDGTGLFDLDCAIVSIFGMAYIYTLDDDSAAAESSPEVVTPDANAGTKRWILQGVTHSTGTAAAPSVRIGNDAMGIYEQATNFMGVSVGGAQRWTISGGSIVGTLTNSARIQNTTTSDTNPVLTFGGDEDTGVGSSGADALSLIAGGVEAARLTEVAGATQVLLPSLDSEGAPTVAFGDGDTGFYEWIANYIAIAIGGTKRFYINGSGIYADNTSGAGLKNLAASDTVPTLVPRRDEETSGVGSVAGYSVSLITRAFEAIRVTHDGSDINIDFHGHLNLISFENETVYFEGSAVFN